MPHRSARPIHVPQFRRGKCRDGHAQIDNYRRSRCRQHSIQSESQSGRKYQQIIVSLSTTVRCHLRTSTLADAHRKADA